MRRLVAAFGLVLAACGGNVSGGGDDDPAGGQEQDDQSEPSTTPKPGGNPDADTELGDCKLGPLRYEATGTSCAWVADNRCYAERDMACNCACPRDRNSQCSSGFEAGPNGHVQVDCF